MFKFGFAFIVPPIAIDFIDPLFILIGIALLTMIASWCAMLSEDIFAILIAGTAFECYAFLFNLFFRLIYQLDITAVTILTVIECGVIGLFIIIKLYWALTGGWHKLKKGQFKVAPF
ncbi:MAG: hypothetical protein ACFFDN_45730 [Candidatus Hodarchaeota archaeon]